LHGYYFILICQEMQIEMDNIRNGNNVSFESKIWGLTSFEKTSKPKCKMMFRFCVDLVGGCMYIQIQNPGAIPRAALINDLTAFGRCSLAVALPVVSTFGIQACPIPTAILSNHLGFPFYYIDDYTPKAEGLYKGLRDLSIQFDAIACGFLGNSDQIPLVEAFLQDSRRAEDGESGCTDPLFFLDPVMGDHGEPYDTITSDYCLKLRRLAAQAHILTPNITEACLLTDIPYRSGEWSNGELAEICNKLESMSDNSIDAPKIVITGLARDGYFGNYIWENHKGMRYETISAGSSRPGTGDLFAAVLLGAYMTGSDFSSAVRQAADFVALSIAYTQEREVPLLEGVLFEPLLSKLWAVK
jgi:pyridoxine kinase